MSRLFAQPIPIRVEADAEGVPTAMYWRGRRYEVVVGGQWRLEDGWWRPGAEVARTYYRLRSRLTGGDRDRTGAIVRFLLCVVFRDDATGEWRLEKVID